MSRTLTAALLFTLVSALLLRTSIATPPEDSEGSGYDLSTSGSGDGSEHGEVGDVMGRPGSKERTFNRPLWSDSDVRSGYVIVSNSKSFLENQQIVGGIIAGGVTGLVLAVILMAILIYRWRNKDNVGYFQGQQTHREEDD
ncbi:syndecan-1-like [Hippoglossus hippoglossus]|uniref:syndecan-1-like n=1 Tax=Hippoglossus hippoglossus TaxID=8267 RepID=UPI00148DC208|nr:syndecan-1-like [Hippoglossus hippoglossus]